MAVWLVKPRPWKRGVTAAKARVSLVDRCKAVSMAWATGAMIHQCAVGRSGSSLRLTDFTAGVQKYSVRGSLVISRISQSRIIDSAATKT
ncbi:hypothetical protein J116_000090 [Streptomyces thermolilacinus SPC6]|uniref:Uncharacterized protein n=1 Tax=Streptomyces thermolilacinus SPC6 TaxID=1306406 RepID=A0A1D3DLC6_9ACTN|nr:hypothetical protein J116_000090 [Streptomyces thermolilacinus SPC6]